ncbi:hypothetical protein BKA69DRAFT_1036707 [Paraphysoderma sedebokerense]|nr:hypothetical protein BKA69DRAFT_1036707 [Paraphysoderma sedebokerense]
MELSYNISPNRTTLLVALTLDIIGLILTTYVGYLIFPEMLRKRTNFWILSAVAGSLLFLSRAYGTLDTILILTTSNKLTPKYYQWKLFLLHSSFWLGYMTITIIRIYRLSLARATWKYAPLVGFALLVIGGLLASIFNVVVLIANITVQNVISLSPELSSLRSVARLTKDPDIKQIYRIEVESAFTEQHPVLAQLHTTTRILFPIIVTMFHVTNIVTDLLFNALVVSLQKVLNHSKALARKQYIVLSVPYLLPFLIDSIYLGLYVSQEIDVSSGADIKQYFHIIADLGFLTACIDAFVFYNYSLRQTKKILDNSGKFDSSLSSSIMKSDETSKAKSGLKKSRSGEHKFELNWSILEKTDENSKSSDTLGGQVITPSSVDSGYQSERLTNRTA